MAINEGYDFCHDFVQMQLAIQAFAGISIKICLPENNHVLTRNFRHDICARQQ